MKLQNHDGSWVTTSDIGEAVTIQHGFITVFEQLVVELKGPLISAALYKDAAIMAIEYYNRNAAEIARAQEQAEIDLLRDTLSEFLNSLPKS
ncbi:MAG: hypothetical protein ACRCY3_12570 [Sphingorhabdus sp.]